MYNEILQRLRGKTARDVATVFFGNTLKSTLVFLVSFLSLDRVELLAYLNLAQLGINFAGNLVLIPLYGGLGAAFSSLAVRVFGGVYIVYFLRKFLFTEVEPDR